MAVAVMASAMRRVRYQLIAWAPLNWSPGHRGPAAR
jgi:hypothetical protein